MQVMQVALDMYICGLVQRNCLYLTGAIAGGSVAGVLVVVAAVIVVAIFGYCWYKAKCYQGKNNYDVRSERSE